MVHRYVLVCHTCLCSTTMAIICSYTQCLQTQTIELLRNAQARSGQVDSDRFLLEDNQVQSNAKYIYIYIY